MRRVETRWRHALCFDHRRVRSRVACITTSVTMNVLKTVPLIGQVAAFPAESLVASRCSIGLRRDSRQMRDANFVLTDAGGW